MSGSEVSAYNARETSTDVGGGVDLDVTVQVDGQSHKGTVTLVERPDGRYTAYGNSPDTWISSGLLQRLQVLPDLAFTDACKAIEIAAQEAIRND